MNWYKSDADTWKEIIETVAAEEHRAIQMIEKDTIQSMFLLEISKSDLPFEHPFLHLQAGSKFFLFVL